MAAKKREFDITRAQKLYEEWKEVIEHLDTNLGELLNAQSMGNVERIAQCKAWCAEAREHEQAAYDALWRMLGR